MKRAIIGLGLGTIMLFVITWCIITHETRIFFPAIILFLLVFSYWLVKKGLNTNKKSNTIFYLDNKFSKTFKTTKIIVPLTIFVLVLFNIYYLEYEKFYLIIIPFFIIFIIINILILAPKSIVFDYSGVRYHVFWKEKWENIIDYELINNTLVIKTKNNNPRIIKNINANYIDDIKSILNNNLAKINA